MRHKTGTTIDAGWLGSRFILNAVRPVVYAPLMHLLVTAGATYEPMDEVRRLTNFSTGKLGSLLADYLAERGHQITLLLAQSASYRGTQRRQTVIPFDTTEDLAGRLEALRDTGVNGLFHAAAVSDFRFGKVFSEEPDGSRTECHGGKYSTRSGKLLAELWPTPKIIRELRRWYPDAVLVGWKYETDGDREEALEKAAEQIRENQTDAAVANGPAYGFGFGLVTAAGANKHYSRTDDLFKALENLVA